MAAKFGVDSYSDHNDLIGKIQAKKTTGTIDEKVKAELEEHKAKIVELNKQLEEKDGLFSKFKEDQILGRMKQEILDKYPYAGKSDEEISKQKKILAAFIDANYKFGLHEDKAALIDANGKVIKDNSLNVINPFEHVVKEMKDYVPQDNGANGGAGNGSPKTQQGGKITTVQFEKEMSERGATSEEMSREYQARVKAGLIED